MNTMEEVNLELDKFSLREEEEMPIKETRCKNYLSAENRTRSTPTSPNCFRSAGQGLGLQSTGGGKAAQRHRESPVIRLALFPRLEKCVSEPEVWGEKVVTTHKELPQGENSCSGSKSEGHISNMSGEKGEEGTTEQTAEKADGADDIEDATKKRSMLSETQPQSQPPVISLRHDTPPQCPGEALIMPRKLQNPCIDSRDHQNLHRELLFNQKMGKNVLNQKSELQRALEKHKESQIKKELELQKQDNRTPFEKVIEERARRLESLEKSSIEEEPVSNKPEFLQVHAKLRARMDSK